MKNLGSSLVARGERLLLNNTEEKKDFLSLLYRGHRAEVIGLLRPLQCFLGRKMPREMWLWPRGGCKETRGSIAVYGLVPGLAAWCYAVNFSWTKLDRLATCQLGWVVSTRPSFYFSVVSWWGCRGWTGYLGSAVSLAAECHGHGWLVRPTICCPYVYVS